MRSRLRWKILLFTVLLPVLLTAGILWTVNRSISDQVHSGIQERLERSSLVFEHLLASRSRRLGVTAGVIVSDPRFNSVLSIPAAPGDRGYRATVQNVARDFAAIAGADLFEVLDRKGRLLASVGRISSTEQERQSLVRMALAGRTVSGVIPAGQTAARAVPAARAGAGRQAAAASHSGVDAGGPFQVRLAPVRHGRAVVGVLVLGAGIGKPLAEELRSLTHSAVTFISRDATAGSTLEPADQAALLAAREGATEHGRVFKVKASQTFLTLVRRIPKSGPDGRDVYAMQRSLDAETAYLPVIEKDLLRLGLFAAVAALLAGMFLAERISRPVARLVRSAEEMERGNFDYPLNSRGRDELGYLTERFKDMRRHERVYVSSLQEVAQMKSDFINVASHELRTPISIIRGYGELFAAGALGPVSAEQERAFREIEQNLDELARVADAATRLADGEQPALDEETERGAPTQGLALVEGDSKRRPERAPTASSSDDNEELRRAA